MIKAIIFSALFVVVSYAALLDDVDKLEKDLENAHLQRASKKSLNDLSIDELVGELKKEVDSLSQEHHDAFRSRFDSIVENTKSLDSILENTKGQEGEDDGMWVKTMNAMADEIIKRSPAVEDQADPKCKDERSDCESLVSYCKSHREKLKSICSKTCGYCGNCENKLGNCELLAKLRQCDINRLRMVQLCPKACHFCRAPAPPKCSKTTHGCCWDKETAKTSESGSNCPACKDQYKYVCKTFYMDCPNFKKAGDFMRSHCPATCALCSTECSDDAKKGFYCKFWKKDLKWCEEKKEIMRHYCPKTCAFC